VVATTMGDDAFGRLVWGEGETGVVGATKFKGADTLEVFAFEEDLGVE